MASFPQLFSTLTQGHLPAQKAAALAAPRALGRALPGSLSRAARGSSPEHLCAEVHHIPLRERKQSTGHGAYKQPMPLFKWKVTEISKWPNICMAIGFVPTCYTMHTHGTCTEVTVGISQLPLPTDTIFLHPSLKCCSHAQETSATG